VNNGSINLSSIPDKTLKLSHATGSTPENAPLCEWRIFADGGTELVIEVNKDPRNYEEIFVYYYMNGKMYPLTSKVFSSCTEESSSVRLDGTTYLIVRTRLLAKNSNYSVLVHQRAESENEGFSVWAYVVIIVFLS
jgi:hypothetical protein